MRDRWRSERPDMPATGRSWDAGQPGCPGEGEPAVCWRARSRDVLYVDEPDRVSQRCGRRMAGWRTLAGLAPAAVHWRVGTAAADRLLEDGMLKGFWLISPDSPTRWPSSSAWPSQSDDILRPAPKSPARLIQCRELVLAARRAARYTLPMSSARPRSPKLTLSLSSVENRSCSWQGGYALLIISSRDGYCSFPELSSPDVDVHGLAGCLLRIPRGRL